MTLPFTCVHTTPIQFVYTLNSHLCKPKIFQIEQRNLNEKHSNIVLRAEMFRLQAVHYKRVTAFVFTRSSQALHFHLAPFRNRAQVVTAKVTFSNNFAPA
jgi:hypothetical protein